MVVARGGLYHFTNPRQSRVWPRGCLLPFATPSLVPASETNWEASLAAELTHSPVRRHAKSFHLVAANCLALQGKLGESVSGQKQPRRITAHACEFRIQNAEAGGSLELEASLGD